MWGTITAVSRMLRFSRYRADLLAIGAFLVALAITMWHRWVYDNWLTQNDIMPFFLPWFELVGDCVRQLDVPGWTLAFSSGSPLAGDPSAGWMYFPVMTAFALFEAQTAFKVMILLQTVIGGLSMYAFCRVLGLRSVAAAMSMFTFGFGPFLYGQTQTATVFSQVMTWIPVGLLGIECAIRAERLLFRTAWACLAALAVSQIAAAWVGQGLINALLVLGGWLGYRAVIYPPSFDVGMARRVAGAAMVGAMTILGGLGLAAAGLLPRLAINAQSNIANGDYSDVLGGDYGAARRSVSSLIGMLLADDVESRLNSVGALTLFLAIAGFLLARQRYCAPFFAIVYVSSFILALEDTPLHKLFYVIPQFQGIHEHAPERMVRIMPFALSILAGIAIQELLNLRVHKQGALMLAIVSGVTSAMILFVGDAAWWSRLWLLGIVFTATVLCLATAGAIPRLAPAKDRTRVFAAVGLIILFVAVQPGRDIVQGIVESGEGPVGALMQGDAETKRLIDLYTSSEEPDSAASFLQDMQEKSRPFRFVGYNGRFSPDLRVSADLYTNRRTEAGTMAVLLNGRGAFLGLEQIQGHNPIHLRWYVEYIDTMNGLSQEYHSVDPTPLAVAESQLLNMLNVRFILVARALPEDRADVQAIADGRAIAYQDEKVTIYEDSEAFGPAWIVHQVRSNNEGECLTLFEADVLAGRQVACVDGEIPDVERNSPERADQESVTITAREDDSLRATARLESPGLVVFSEVYAEGWNAYVDGERVDVLRTNHALRGVAVPAGDHTIDLRYEPDELRIGLWTTGVIGSAMLMMVVAAGITTWRGRFRETTIQ